MKQRSPLRNRLEWTLVRTLLATLRLGPRSFAFSLARLYVGILDLFIPKLRRVAKRNVVLALPDMDSDARSRIVDASFYSLARLVVTLARMPSITAQSDPAQNISSWIRYDGLEHFHTAKAHGKGVLFATAHLGNWELSAVAHGLLTEPMHVVVRALDNPLLDAESTRLRTLSGNRVIGKRDYARGILRALAANEAVGILIDQNVAAAEGIFVPFFGMPACVSPSFAKLAAHSGAMIIPGFALWSPEENRYILKFYPPFHAGGDAEAATRRIHAHLEEVIRAYPGQWLWMHRRWKTRPEGEPPIY
ncbi:MAG: lysophospholipid acyltransferase family protein [Acidobacteriota bacterium]